MLRREKCTLTKREMGSCEERNGQWWIREKWTVVGKRKWTVVDKREMDSCGEEEMDSGG